MMTLVIGWCLAVATGVFLWWLVRFYLQLKPVGSGLTALAVKEFHDATSSLMKTPADLPDEVLETILFMGKNAFAKGSHWKLRDAIRRDRRDQQHSEAPKVLREAIQGMRPELQELYTKAVVSWMRIVCNRSLLGGLLIYNELQKIQLQKGASKPSVENEALRVLPGLGGCLT